MYRSTLFLTSALVGGECLVSRSGCFTSLEIAPGTDWIGGWVMAPEQGERGNVVG
jgi:hypothetical protein